MLVAPDRDRPILTDALAGQKVVTLVEGVRQVGTYAVNWDGRDSAGRALASGVYLYELWVGDRVETRKLALVR